MISGELLLLIMRIGILILLALLIIVLITTINKEMKKGVKGSNEIKKTEYGLPAFLKMIFVGGTKPKNNENITLNKEIVIGRNDFQANVVIDSNFISGRHTRIFPFGESIMIEDLGSTNGTYVNNELIDSPKKLSENDIVMVGDTEFKVV